MTFTDGWALAGLVLLVPLIALHLRDRGRELRDVPSLLLWQGLEVDSPADSRRFRLPALPLLLLLQALALALLVLVLAQPVGHTRPRSEQVIVLDDSFWMQVPGRLRAAEEEIEHVEPTVPAGGPVRIVLAGPDPEVLYQGDASGVQAVLRRVEPSAAPADLSSALTVAAGLLTGPRDRVVIVHAPEDSVPRSRSSPGELSTFTLGEPIADQGIFSPTARCGIGAANLCGVLATVRNTSAHGSSITTSPPQRAEPRCRSPRASARIRARPSRWSLRRESR